MVNEKYHIYICIYKKYLFSHRQTDVASGHHVNLLFHHLLNHCGLLHLLHDKHTPLHRHQPSTAGVHIVDRHRQPHQRQKPGDEERRDAEPHEQKLPVLHHLHGEVEPPAVSGLPVVVDVLGWRLFNVAQTAAGGDGREARAGAAGASDAGRHLAGEAVRGW